VIGDPAGNETARVLRLRNSPADARTRAAALRRRLPGKMETVLNSGRLRCARNWIGCVLAVVPGALWQ